MFAARWPIRGIAPRGHLGTPELILVYRRDPITFEGDWFIAIEDQGGDWKDWVERPWPPNPQIDSTTAPSRKVVTP